MPTARSVPFLTCRSCHAVLSRFCLQIITQHGLALAKHLGKWYRTTRFLRRRRPMAVPSTTHLRSTISVSSCSTLTSMRRCDVFACPPRACPRRRVLSARPSRTENCADCMHGAALDHSEA